MGSSGIRNDGIRRSDRSNVSHSKALKSFVSYLNFLRYEAQLESDWLYILQDSGTKVLIVSTEKIYEIVKEYNTSKKIGKIQTVLCLDAPADKPHSLQ